MAQRLAVTSFRLYRSFEISLILVLPYWDVTLLINHRPTRRSRTRNATQNEMCRVLLHRTCDRLNSAAFYPMGSNQWTGKNS